MRGWLPIFVLVDILLSQLLWQSCNLRFFLARAFVELLGGSTNSVNADLSEARSFVIEKMDNLRLYGRQCGLRQDGATKACLGGHMTPHVSEDNGPRLRVSCPEAR
jgi:hypothetical protein